MIIANDEKCIRLIDKFNQLDKGLDDMYDYEDELVRFSIKETNYTIRLANSFEKMMLQVNSYNEYLPVETIKVNSFEEYEDLIRKEKEKNFGRRKVRV